MARQKPDISQVKHIVEPATAAPDEEPEADSSEGDDSDDSSSSQLDDETLALDAATLLERGKSALKEMRWDEAIRLLESAVTKRASELDGDELHPGLAEYWMEYGDALFTRDECTEELFALDTPKKDDDQNNKEIAYESLDAARLCYERQLQQDIQGAKLVVQDDCKDPILVAPTGEGGEAKVTLWTPQSCTREDRILRNVKNAIFVRLRLGDFHQAFHEYERAIEEFQAALALCRRFAMPFSVALTPAVPLAHCFLALDSELTEVAFELCVTIIDKEVNDENAPTPERKKLLISTQHDLKLQLEEYQRDRSRLIEEAKNAVRDVWKTIPENNTSPEAATSPLEMPNSTGEPLNLGVVGKKRTRKESNIP